MKTLDERKPGDKGYAAYWRQEFGRAAPEVKKQRNGNVSGKAIIAVMNVYGARMNNNTGRSRLGQGTLASLSGTSVKVVQRVQGWASETGWLVIEAAAIPGRAGKQVRCLVPRHAGQRRTDVAVSSADMAVSGDDKAVSSGQWTLSEGLSVEDSQSPHPDIDNAPCFCHGLNGCPDKEATDTATPAGPLPEKSLSDEGSAAEAERCENHLSFVKGTCHYCDRWEPTSNLPEWKQEELHEKRNAEEGWDEYDDPGLSASAPRYRGRSRA